MNFISKKLSIVLGAILLHLSIGSIYAWSILTKPLMLYFDTPLPSVQLVFSIAIFCLGLTTIIGSKIIAHNKTSTNAIFATIFFISGLLVSQLAIKYHSIYLLYLGYGVIGGIGVGIGYITPISILITIFPNKRGFAIGSAIMGFGFASLIASIIYKNILNIFDINYFFLLISVIYTIMMIIASLLLSPINSNLDLHTNNYQNINRLDIIYSKKFIIIWLIIFLNIFCGISLLSIASLLLQNLAHLTIAKATIIIGFLGIANGLGRIFWASFSDLATRKLFYSIIMIVQICCLIIMLNTSINTFIIVGFLLIISCYGGGFALLPAYLSDVYPVKLTTLVHGMILTAWSIAGLIGPYLTALIYKNQQKQDNILLLMLITIFIAFILSLFLSKKN
jgi:OFA family oxalate/formate antiporter-like MFS transporter